ncbi:hypothetical protein AB0K00_40205 [Dactylosporangium sp. NPDC049525]|uniref:hypothetical protein n=1 Tax=Dactylosporangium sp. NPDC049525 TaxID=3154730 RepID=UPI0034198291
MVVDPPSRTSLRAVPGLPAGSRVLVLPGEAPFAERYATWLASEVVGAACAQDRTRLFVGVCGGGACTMCTTYAGTVMVAASRALISTVRFVPVTTAAGSVPALAREPGPGAAVSPSARYGPGDQLVVGSYADAVQASKRAAVEVGAGDGNLPGPYGNHGHYALAVHMVGILDGLPEPPDMIWLPHDDGIGVAVDAALRLLGWPTTLVAVTTEPADLAATPSPADGIPAARTGSDDGADRAFGRRPWPLSPLQPRLGPRIGANHTVAAEAGQIEHARRLLSAAGIFAKVTGALGVAGLLHAHHHTDRTPGTGADNHVALVDPSGRPDKPRPAATAEEEDRPS